MNKRAEGASQREQVWGAFCLFLFFFGGGFLSGSFLSGGFFSFIFVGRLFVGFFLSGGLCPRTDNWKCGELQKTGSATTATYGTT